MNNLPAPQLSPEKQILQFDGGFSLDNVHLISRGRKFIGAISMDILQGADGGCESAESIFLANYRPCDVQSLSLLILDELMDGGTNPTLLGVVNQGVLCGFFAADARDDLLESISSLKTSDYCDGNFEIIDDATCMAELKALASYHESISAPAAR